MEIGPEFAACLGLRDGQMVTVEPLEKVATATTVLVEPASPDDWEILELNAGFIEEQLLSQIQYVFEGERVPVWVGSAASTVLYMNVNKVAGADVAPPIDGYARLSRDCQVIVAPKPRQLRHIIDPARADIAGEFRAVPATEADIKSALGERRFPESAVALVGSSIPVKDSGVAVQVFPVTSGSSYRQSNKVSALLRVFPCAKLPPTCIAFSHCVLHHLSCRWHSLVNVRTVDESEIAGTTIDSALLREVVVQEEQTTQPGTSPAASTSAPAAAAAADSQQQQQPDAANEKVIVAFQNWLKDAVGGATAPVPFSSGGMIHMRIEGDAAVTKLYQLCLTSQQQDANTGFYILHETSCHASTTVSVGPPLYVPTPYDVDHPDLRNHSLSEVGGYVKEVREARDYVTSLLVPDLVGVRTALAAPPLGGILVLGPSGVGKTLVSTMLAAHFYNSPHCFAYAIVVDCNRLAAQKYDTLKASLSDVLWDALCNAPSVLVLDNLHAIAPAPAGEGEPSVRELQGAALVAELLQQARMAYHERPLCVAATARTLASLHAALKSPATSPFGKTVELLPPPRADREKIMERILERCYPSLERDVDLSAVAPRTEGYVASDLSQLVRRAVLCSEITSATENTRDDTKPRVTTGDFRRALKDFTPVALMGINNHAASASETTWDDIGGLQDVKKSLQETLEWPAKYPELFASCPIRMRSGYLYKSIHFMSDHLLPFCNS
eukprot:TRINITY_DN6551_c0_g1_i1.p1 TRINITY_DN6551_c0_g1~~TRINITY_DN6551_c0_g1_i1.p1  ORF type:complete len:816 (-),score=186.40 TRINITY_DN6551_c0_g1_i1:30-2210(-)